MSNARSLFLRDGDTAVVDAPAAPEPPAAPKPPAADVAPAAARRWWSRIRPELVGLLILAGVLNLWALDQNGFANDYYAAAVRSMTTNWSNFLWGSFDPAGLQTVDKPPLAFMIQALSVRVFGYGSWAILVSQALMGVASVGLTYDLVRRRFGRWAACAGGLVLAFTPIAVAISRHNNPDALLTLCCVLALWATVRALEEGRTRWLVLAGVAVGLGFETKMAAALLVVPGIVAAWLWVAPRGRGNALRSLAAAGSAMLAVGLAWPLLVTIVPASSRPYISGTSDNSIWSLILGYNGLGRLFGQSGGPGGGTGGAGGGLGGGGGLFGGTPGPLRLLNEALGGQGGWLLGVALVGGVAVLVSSRLRRSDARTGWLIAVGGAFLTCAVAFSKADGIFHPYYVAQMAPFTAALVGAGGAELARRDLPARILAPLAVAAGVLVELKILGDHPGDLDWLAPVLVTSAAIPAAALAFDLPGRWRAGALAAALALLLIAPATWAVQTLGHATSGTFPAGGPASAGVDGFGGGGPGGGGRGGFGRVGGAQGGPPGMQSGQGTPPSFGGGAQGGPPGTQGGQGTSSGFGPGGQRTPGGGSAQAGPGTPGGGSARGGASRTGRWRGTGGGMFGGGQSLTAVLAYIKAHGGGTLGVSSQSTAAPSIIEGTPAPADVAGLGGFSGRESDISVDWVANAVQDGRLRWILSEGSGAGGGFGGGGGFGRGDGRVGASKAIAAAETACTKVTSSALGTSSGTLYDCSGKADALRAAAR